MSRPGSVNDFTLDVDGIGEFRFARRTMRDEMKINSEYSRITEGLNDISEWFGVIANAIATLKVLTVSAPDGWDIDAMDPLEDETYRRLLAVHRALRDKEELFRKSKKSGEGTGQGDGEVS